MKRRDFSTQGGSLAGTAAIGGARYQLVVNLKTAKATSINLPPEFVALADEVIE